MDGFCIAQILLSRNLNALAHTMHASIHTEKNIIYTYTFQSNIHTDVNIIHTHTIHANIHTNIYIIRKHTHTIHVNIHTDINISPPPHTHRDPPTSVEMPVEKGKF